MFILGNTEHTKNDYRCTECWRGYPMRCVCQGYIHAQFVREAWNGEIELKIACDSCGENYKFPENKPGKRKRKFRRHLKPRRNV